MNFYVENIIIGAGPAGIQLAYFFKKNNIEYVQFEKNNYGAGFFFQYPVGKQLISINKRFTGNDNKDFNLRHDWNSLLNDEDFLFKDYSNKFYPNSNELFEYLNDFIKKNNLEIKYSTEVKCINLSNNSNHKYKIELFNREEIYYCNKLIVCTGLGIPNEPKFKFSGINKPKHYADFNKEFFDNEDKLKEFNNKKVLLIGSGNASYELANILNNYTSNIIILGSDKNMSIVSHYAGDLRSINLPFLDTFYLKSMNGIDLLTKNDRETLKIIQNTNEQSNNYLKYKLIHNENTYYSSKDLEYFAQVGNLTLKYLILIYYLLITINIPK